MTEYSTPRTSDVERTPQKAKFLWLGKRYLLAAWFALSGLLGSSLLFFKPAIQKGLVPSFLFLGLPTVCAGLVGYFRGPAIVDSTRTKGLISAGLRGFWITIWTYCCFAVLFPILYSLTRKEVAVKLPEL